MASWIGEIMGLFTEQNQNTKPKVSELLCMLSE
jgi:hypothetical protein